MKSKNVILKLKLIITALIVITLYCVKGNVYATLSGEQLLKFNDYTITKKTDVIDLKKKFGNPKYEYDSPFGGKAYSFYDDSMTWLLHVETNSEGVIKSYGCLYGNFESAHCEYGKKYTGYTYNGSVINHYKDNTPIGTYEFCANYDELQTFKDNFMASSEYLRQMQKTAVIASKLVVKNNNYNTSGKTFNHEVISDEIFYMDEALKENSSNLYEYSENAGKTNYINTIKSGIPANYYPDPISLGAGVQNYTRGDNYTYVFFDISVKDKDTFRLFTSTMFVDPEFLNQKEIVSLTEEELSLLEVVKAKYEEYNTHGRAITNYYDVEPQVSELPVEPGIWSKNALLMTTDYLNIARVGMGLNPVELDDELTQAAQAKAALVYYANNNGLAVDHYMDKPECFDDEIYQKAMSHMNENLYSGDIQSSVAGALNDGYGDPVSCGHRYNLLNPLVDKWGVGSVGAGISFMRQGVHKFSGYMDNNNEIVAWPSKGIFPMDMAYQGIGNWSAKFYMNYSVLSTTTVSIKNLNNGNTYDITGTNSNAGKFLYASEHENLVSFRDNSIAYEDGDVFEITLKGVEDDNTKLVVDYTYRSVFTSLYSVSKQKAESIQVNSDNIELDVGNTFKITAKIMPENTANKLLRYASSDEDVVAVREDGLIIMKGEGEATITVTSNSSGIKKEIKVKSKNTTSVIPEEPDSEESDSEEQDAVIPDKKLKYKKGDLDKDGVVNANDAAVALKLYNYGDVTAEEIEIGDMDNDGIINANDAALILKIYNYGEQ